MAKIVMLYSIMKFASHVGKRSQVTDAVVTDLIPYPFKVPYNEDQLHTLEAAYDVLDLYLWLR